MNESLSKMRLNGHFHQGLWTTILGAGGVLYFQTLTPPLFVVRKLLRNQIGGLTCFGLLWYEDL